MDKVERNVYACSYTLPFRGNGALLRAMHKAKSLYNAALWYYRQALDEHHLAEKEGRDPLVEYPDYYKMERKFRDERQINYFDLPQKVSQQVLRDVQSDWSSYVAHVVRNKAYPEGSPERKEKINPPRYKKKEGYARLRYTIQAISFKRYPGKACPSGIDVGLDIPSFINPYRIQQLVIEPDGADYIRVTFIYKVDMTEMLTDNGRIMGIDLGVNNLATCGTNVGPGIIINGRPLKSINQYFNKKLAKMKSDNDALLDKELKRKVETQRHHMTRNIERLFRKRKYKIKDYLHNASCRIFEYAAANGITTIVVGKNAGWKRECSMGTQNNQNFVQIPHARFIDILAYKARARGIAFITVEESYTSKCSFIDGEDMCHHDRYLGRRIKRGLFRSKEGILINADLNGALNIIRKAVPNAFAEGIEAVVVPPTRTLVA